MNFFIATVSGWSYLPSFRWENVTAYSTFSPGGLLGPLSDPLGTLSSVFFQFANFIWRVIIEMLRIGVGSSFTSIGASSNPSSSPFSSINTAFAALGHTLQSGILIPLLLVVAIALFLRAVVKGGVSPGGILKEVFFIIFPLGALFGMVAAASNNAGINSAWSPAWIINQSSQLPAKLGTSPTGLASLFGNSYTSWMPTSSIATAGYPSCVSYVDSLKSQAYNAFIQQGDTPTQAQMNVSLSSLWEASYLQTWIGAEFPSAAGYKVFCHYLDANANIVPSQQQAVMAYAYNNQMSPVPPPPTKAIVGLHQTQLSLGTAIGVQSSQTVGGVFGPFPPVIDPQSTQLDAMDAWATCAYQNGVWRASPMFAPLTVTTNNSSTTSSGQPSLGRATLSSQPSSSSSSSGLTTWGKLNSTSNGPCQQWYTQGKGIYSNSPFNLSGSSATAEVYVNSQGTQWPSVAQQQAVYQYLTSVGGGNGSGIVQSVVAFITSVIYLFSFGGIGLALLLSHLIVEILLLVLPILLLLLMFQGTRRKVIQLFVAGLSLALMNVIFLVLISVFLMIDSFMQQLLNNTGYASSTLEALGPLLALIVLSMVMKHFGLPSLLNPLSASRIGLSFTSANVRNNAPDALTPFGKQNPIQAVKGLQKTDHYRAFQSLNKAVHQGRRTKDPRGGGGKVSHARAEALKRSTFGKKQTQGVFDAFGIPQGGKGKGTKPDKAKPTAIPTGATKNPPSAGASSNGSSPLITGGGGGGARLNNPPTNGSGVGGGATQPTPIVPPNIPFNLNHPTRSVFDLSNGESPFSLHTPPPLEVPDSSLYVPGQDGLITPSTAPNNFNVADSNLLLPNSLFQSPPPGYVETDMGLITPMSSPYTPREIITPTPPPLSPPLGVGATNQNTVPPASSVPPPPAAPRVMQDTAKPSNRDLFKERIQQLQISNPEVTWKNFNPPDSFYNLEPQEQAQQLSNWVASTKNKHYSTAKRAAAVGGAAVGAGALTVMGAPVAVAAVAGYGMARIAARNSHRSVSGYERVKTFHNKSAAARQIRAQKQEQLQKIATAARSGASINSTETT